MMNECRQTPGHRSCVRRYRHPAILAGYALALAVLVLVSHPMPARADLAQAWADCAANNWTTNPPRHYDMGDESSFPLTVDGARGLVWSSAVGMSNFHVIRIGAIGKTRIDYWGTQKPVRGEGSVADGFPLFDAPMYSLIARVDDPNKGEFVTPVGIRNSWFPVGEDSGCIVYQGSPGNAIVLQINDSNLDDNAGGPWVSFGQWW